MREKLVKLYGYLLNNQYIHDASIVEALLTELDQKNGLADVSKERLSSMCSPRYLGDLHIEEFPDPYMWWNFLGEIKAAIE